MATEKEPVLGVLGISRKVDEHRVPIHPAHLERIDPALRARMVLEEGYGERFGYSDADLTTLVRGVSNRTAVIDAADTVLLAKPQARDLEDLHEGQTLWGWPHCVQDREMTQLAIDKKLTLIAFEAMNHWAGDGGFSLHVFHKNNELAGYSSVIHSMALTGVTGDYGRRLTAVVIGFGATARGAVTALKAHGVSDIRVLTNRKVASVAAPIHAAQMIQFDHDGGPYLSEVITDDRGRVPLAPFLAESDIVVNCTLQDPNDPLLYLRTEDLGAFEPGSLIIDVSCDAGMGFDWARPTTFAEPMFTVGKNIDYYAVDHSPSYLWNSASWEISEALLPFLPLVMGGPDAWGNSETVTRAIEIRDGAVANPAILEFQHRALGYPHEPA
ncbi:MAG: N(5)-(carboxyethyl)ornithine synthase [Micrococcaceae bacterium]|uniref:N(5)-(carboxyethyl)ornithine synthase n=1 Tax=unclassified Arthrobacter TaxID=235627 RepID=UPI0026555BFD|nr:N(5)-(carboxyethyl)ornithine synthase [Micrococcaceae bacterium]MDN5878349.1 N(5)-(carboxyethyl)ornithine synthase [Micrococcaceae bacterium]MDN5885936.1 N(5)-(carboxyethyl)ornithine synthase [Micrococcaceae bacterium]MDN5904667.1 N(5)-(carboxyethyl)ornithine synthase [Micrococcaceae bacterium]MDN6177858.1 N(5)-(carboxyethyl)ornithine synthase [Micrococcaceae bacterium]